jgi:hypothetical protein
MASHTKRGNPVSAMELEVEVMVVEVVGFIWQLLTI